jgi:Putative phage abortive infection protein
MIEMLNQIVNAMDVDDFNDHYVGKDCFSCFRKVLFNTYYNNSEICVIEAISDAYDIFYDRYQTELGHYFRILYNIFRYIDESEFSDGIYAKILRAQLSNQEMLIMFYNNNSERGKPFARLAERFELYDNMDTEWLFHPEHIELASRKSFGKNPMTLPRARERRS